MLPGIVLVQAYILSALVSRELRCAFVSLPVAELLRLAVNSRTNLKRISTSAASHTITSVYEGEGPPGMPQPPLPSHPNDGSGRLEQHVFRSSSSRSFVEGIKITQIKYASCGL